MISSFVEIDTALTYRRCYLEDPTTMVYTIAITGIICLMIAIFVGAIKQALH